MRISGQQCYFVQMNVMDHTVRTLSWKRTQVYRGKSLQRLRNVRRPISAVREAEGNSQDMLARARKPFGVLWTPI